MLEADFKSKIDGLWNLFWSGGIANPLTAIEQISYLIFMKKLDEEDIKRKKDSKFTKKQYSSIFKDNLKLRWSHWRHFEAEKMLNHVQDKVFPFIKNLNSNSRSNFSNLMKDAVFIIPKSSLLVEAVGIIESLEIQDQNQDTQGDIYEYLLSTLQTSGKNGQFRTPRHIINMMCQLVDPKIGQIICDPACGTGGFLIGAYQHILRQNTSPKFITKDEEGKEHGFIGDKIKDKKVWDYLKNKAFYGFDFDSSMLRISAMNMNLHGVGGSHIQYSDSLSENNKEKDRYDVILANPPFKGSIDKDDINSELSRVVKTNRTELLFIAQMIRLLKIGGHCAVIVPSGVLFRSDRASVSIRKKIVEDTQLEAVISMPSGVFKPYAGVSTAVLLFTKGGETDKVWFYNMTADGFSLDDKRGKIKENDIPDIIEKWKKRKKLKKLKRGNGWFFVDKEKIVESGDYSFNENIYKEKVSHTQSKWPMVRLGDVCEVYQPKTISRKEMKENGRYVVFGVNGVIGRYDKYNHDQKEVLITCRGATCGTINMSKEKSWVTGNAMVVTPKHKNDVNKHFLFNILLNSNLSSTISGSAQPQITRQNLVSFQIPLPPLEIQKEMVAEIKKEQSYIDSCKKLIEINEKKIKTKIDEVWNQK